LGTAEVKLECSSGSFARATLRIVRPEVGNALSREGAEQLSEAVDLLAADPPAASSWRRRGSGSSVPAATWRTTAG